MTDTRDKILIIDIDPVHLSQRERALRAIYGHPAADALIALDAPPRPSDVEVRPKMQPVKQQFTRAPKRKPYHKEKSAALKRLLAK